MSAVPPRDLGSGIPAWLREPGHARVPPRDALPDLSLYVVEDAGDVLTVEVLKGALESRKTLVFMAGRGNFVVVATLTEEARGTRVLLRLHRFETAQAPRLTAPRSARDPRRS